MAFCCCYKKNTVMRGGVVALTILSVCCSNHDSVVFGKHDSRIAERTGDPLYREKVLALERRDMAFDAPDVVNAVLRYPCSTEP